MNQSFYIAGDWGTSNLRLYLCTHSTEEGSVLIETRLGKGISEINGDFEEHFFTLTQDWFEQYGHIPVLLSGMIGSTIGWKEAPYLTCPVGAQEISEGCYTFEARDVTFSILAGLTTTNPLGISDVMRGEELQLLGWHQLNKKSTSDRLFALPGTHNKWTLFKSNKVETFLSAFTGELFSILRNHSVLISGGSDLSGEKSDEENDTAAFQEGLIAAQKLDEASLLHLLFSVRSRQVLGEIQAHQSAPYLSGLIIMADVRGAFDTFKRFAGPHLGVTIIGEPALSQNYLTACQHLGVEADCISSTSVAIAGFAAVYEKIYE
jgi:2-dehydro-3-deoxygalactonokinase